MLRIYPVILEWLESLAPVIRVLASCDRHLADQLRRSSTAVVLNVAEGSGAVGGCRRKAYRVALAEMREALAAIDVAVRLGYVAAFDADGDDRQQRILATLIRLAVPLR